MTTSEQVLVIILSVFLAIFLLLGITALAYTIKILKSIKRVTQKAETIADKAEAVGEFFSNTARPAAIATLIGNMVHTIKGKRDKGGNHEERN